MGYQIVCDSSSNLFALPGVPYTTVPMKIATAQKEYVDGPELDLQSMVTDLKNYKGKSGSSCPNVQEWLDAFGDADVVFGITISKHLSGSYNAAQQAAQVYMEENPGKKAYILDSLATGPEMMMMVDKIRELMEAGLDCEAVMAQVLAYHNHIHTLFCLQSMNNLARNGRVSPAAAKIAGLLGIRVIGDAQGGQITPVHKPRGEKKALQLLVEMIAERGLQEGGLVRIAHCFGEETAQTLADMLRERFPGCRIMLEQTTALCSFYAEEGGLIIGLEGSFNANNDNSKF